MTKQLEKFELALHKAALAKSDKVIKNALEKYEIRRDMDVEELHLDNQDLSELRLLDRFKNLHRLWLQSNKIKKLPFLYRCDSIVELYLANNLLQSIDNCFKTLKNLRILSLNGNQLTSLISVTNELACLPRLDNLSLYDNPISLEVNYTKLILFKCLALKIFDRHLITNIEKRKAFHFYEPRKLDIEQKNGFMRCCNNYIFLNKQRRHDNNNNNNKLNLSTTYILNDDEEDEEDNYKLQSIRNNMRRSIREFSYFDWSRVKLYENDYVNDQLKNINIFNNNNEDNNNNNTTKTRETLPQVITIRFS